MAQQRYYASSALPTTLAAALGSTGNPSVNSISGLPSSYPFTVLIDWGLVTQEAISVTSAPTGTGPYVLPCTRGIDGTSAQAHSSGAIAVHGVTAQDFTQWSAFIDALTGTAASSFLPQLTANVTVTSSGPLAINTVTEVSAGSNLTMTLPTSVAGAVIVCEKSDATVNTVAVTGSVRGVGSSTVTLRLQNESEMFLGYAGSWWPVAGHKTLGSLDSRYSTLREFPVALYAGADPTGATDSSAAVNAAYAAAIAAGGGVVSFGTGTWKFGTVSIPAVQHSYQYLGSNVHFRFAGPGATIITPNAANTPLFNVNTSIFQTAAGVRFTGGFTVMAHPAGSTGPAIDLSWARQFVIESPSYFDSSKGTSGSPGTYAQCIGLGPGTYACRIDNPLCEGQKLGTSFIGVLNPATSIANGNTITNPLCENNTATYMLDVAGTDEMNITGGIIEGNTVTAAIRLGYQTRVRGIHFEGNAAYAMDAHGADTTDPGTCWLESNVYNSGSGTLTIPASVNSGTILIGPLGSLAIADNTKSYFSIIGAALAAPDSITLNSPLAHTPALSATTSGTVTIDPKAGDYQRIHPTANVTIGNTVGDQVDGQDLAIEVTQPASGGPCTVSWGGQFVFSGGSTPAASTTASAVDVFRFRWNGTAARWIEQYRHLSYVTALQASNNLSDLASKSAAIANLGLVSASDPLSVGFNSTAPPFITTTHATQLANYIYFMPLIAGGYSMTQIYVQVVIQSGNIAIGWYKNSAGAPGALQATSGSVACPAAGLHGISLGGTYTPALGDFLAVAVDNTTAQLTQISGPAFTLFPSAGQYQNNGSLTFPATAAPSGGASTVPVLQGK